MKTITGERTMSIFSLDNKQYLSLADMLSTVLKLSNYEKVALQILPEETKGLGQKAVILSRTPVHECIRAHQVWSSLCEFQH